MDKTVVVFICNQTYFLKARRSIIDVRSKGEWHGDLVLITIDFNLNPNFKQYYSIIEKKFPLIDKTILLNKIGNGFSNSDKREVNLINQWEKLHVFDDYFKQWNRVIFLDAGLRILDSIDHLLELKYKNSILAPIDGPPSNYNIFNCQLSYDDPNMIDKISNEFGNIFDQYYFLNCIWIYDTSILEKVNKQELIQAMNTYICCRTNEMGIMNLIFHFKYGLWKPFPIKNKFGKFLFEWSELNYKNTNWTQYCYIKYPSTISYDDC